MMKLIIIGPNNKSKLLEIISLMDARMSYFYEVVVVAPILSTVCINKAGETSAVHTRNNMFNLVLIRRVYSI
jgi:hypothetical protein